MKPQTPSRTRSLPRIAPPSPVDPPEPPATIELNAVEREGLAALRREEVALAMRVHAAASAVLLSHGVPKDRPDIVYDAIRDQQTGAIIGFRLAQPPRPT